jgi:hypothetical protein
LPWKKLFSIFVFYGKKKQTQQQKNKEQRTPCRTSAAYNINEEKIAKQGHKCKYFPNRLLISAPKNI